MSNCTKISGVPLVMVTGGALDQVTQPLYRIHDGVKCAAKTGYKKLLETHCILDAVEAAINVLENDTTFNAGRGSALNIMGGIEMGACIMEGKYMKTGSAALLKTIVNPISLARMVMERTEHAFIAGEGAQMFVKKMGLQEVSEEELKTPEMIAALQDYTQGKSSARFPPHPCRDTVGCVVVDCQGHVACGSSSGGMTGRLVGRIGDAPFPGCGLYCDDNIGATVCSGHGDSIIRYNLANRILDSMEQGLSPEDATVKELCGLGRKHHNTVGAITINIRGDVGIGFTTERMSWACQQGNELHYGYEPGQHIVEILPQKC